MPALFTRLTLVAAALVLVCAALRSTPGASQPPPEPLRIGSDAANPFIIEDRREMSLHTLATHAEIRAAKPPASFFDSGGVELSLIVAPDGHVISAEAVGGARELYDQAEHAALSWKYAPFERDGVPVFAKIEDYISELPPERRPEVIRPFPQIRNWNSLRISLSRTACFGTCPGYSVEIRGDGTVIYEGRIYVAVGGRHTSRVSVETVRELVAAFQAADYFRTYDEYRADVTDNPTHRIAITFDGIRKSVIDYVGLHAGMPATIADLERAIDRAAGTQKWIKITPETLPSLVAENYFTRPERGTSLLATMIEAGANSELVRDLIQKGASVNAKAEYVGTPLMAAVARRDTEITETLLAAGAGQNDRQQMSLGLFVAAQAGSPELVRTFLERGANPNYRDENRTTVLMRGVFSGNPEVVAQILSTHVDVNARDNEGETALAQLVGNWSPGEEPVRGVDRGKTMQWLLDAGADWWTNWDILHANACRYPEWGRCTVLMQWISEHPRPNAR